MTTTMSSLAAIEVSIESDVARVMLNRPEKRNAITGAMWRELPVIFNALGAIQTVKVIVLSGQGQHFSAGADIAEFAEIREDLAAARAYETWVDEACDAIEVVGKPVIAAVAGACMGGACNLAMACDFRVAAQGAAFAIPSARMSIVYGVRGTKRLLSLVGVNRAKRFLYQGTVLTAAQAVEWGLADSIATDLAQDVDDAACKLAGQAPLSIAGAKFILNRLVMNDLDAATGQHLIDAAAASDDYREGRQAFAERRAPKFSGR
jgi:enoyl-CoA hydratase/carnithine racemase